MSFRMNLRAVYGKGRLMFATDQKRQADANRRAARSVALVAIGMAVLLPDLAVAAPWDSMATQVLAMFTGGLARTIAILAVIACGIAAIAGKLSWDWVIKIIVGIVLIFGAATIVDYLIAAV